MRVVTIGGIMMGLWVAACAPQQQASVRLVSDNALTNTPNVIFVTPTQGPTTIPTIELITPSATYTRTPLPTNTPDGSQLQAQCQANLLALYTSATELCLGKPDGYICNAGSAPSVEPEGAIANTLASVGAVVEANLIDTLHTPALLTNTGGGIAYMRLSDGISMSALLIGDVEMRDTTPEGFPKWKNFTVKTVQSAASCADQPMSAFVLQGEYGRQTSLVVNGVSLDLNGTLVVITSENQSSYLSLEGLVRLIVNGTAYSLYAGQQLDVSYNGDDLRNPIQALSDAKPLTWDIIKSLPVVLLDRPVLLPQPGYVETTGNVNMRVEPSETSQLIYQVPAGQILDVLGQNPDTTWFHVRLGNGETGWMRADLLNRKLGTINLTYEATPLPPQRFGRQGNSAIVVAAQGGNLRQGPDTYFNTLTTLTVGTEVELMARSSYSPWVKVRGAGAEGWVALITLETQSVIGFLPVDYNAPLPPQPTSTPIFQFGGGHAYPNPQGGQ